MPVQPKHQTFSSHEAPRKAAQSRPQDGAAVRTGAGKGLGASIEELEERVGELIALCIRLQDENEALRRGHRKLEQDRAERVDRNHKARTRLNSVLLRLRDMERQ